jgi:hypothetical protein
VGSKLEQAHPKIGFRSTGPLKRLCSRNRIKNWKSSSNLSKANRRSLPKILSIANISRNSTKSMPLTHNALRPSMAKSISMLSMAKINFPSMSLIC